MEEDFLAPLAITMMIVFAGWLVYYPPRSKPPQPD